MAFQHEALNSSHDIRLLSPIVIPRGSVIYDGTHLTVKTSECFNAVCEPQSNDALGEVMLPGDAISIYTIFPYFHFFFETAIQLFPLVAHQVFKNYPNAGILCFGTG
jgi:hypothetical protein